MTTELNLDGYTDVPSGKIAFVVTFLEMTQAPPSPLCPKRHDVSLQRWQKPDAERYRQLFRDVGEDWIWFGRLAMEVPALQQLLSEPTRENYRPTKDGKSIGTLELNYAKSAEPEIAYFGLVPGAIGDGLGKWLMNEAIEMAWSRPETKRLWLHTCTGDSPQAIRFYKSCGFTPYKRCIEIADDPRLSGLHTCDKAPHVPVI